MLQTQEELQPNPPKEEAAHAARLLKRIESFEKQLKERSKGWKKAREYANGCPNDDGEGGLVRVNLIGSMLEAVQPNIYAKAPEIAVTPDEHISTEDYPIVKPFCKTLQAALNVFLIKEGKLKKRGKAAVRSALTATTGWVKVVYQIERQEDPLIRNRLNDTQDNVEQIKTLLEETKQEGGECQEYEAKLFELKQQIEGLNKQLEVVVSEGLVIDVVSPEDIIVLDDSCRDIDEFMQSSEIVHKIKMTVGAFKNQFKISPPKGAKKYTTTDDDSHQKTVDEDDELLTVYEVWSLKDLSVYTLCEGSKQYVRPPYQPETLGEQWYPFFGLQLRRVDNVRYPLSLVEQLIELQDEYNTRRTRDANHRSKNIPVRVFNKAAGITDEELRAINNRSIETDVIGITANTNEPLQSVLAGLQEIPYNPAMYDTSDVMRDMEMVGNAQDASRGAINKAKTATEAEIMSAGMQSRTSEALDVIEDWLSDIAVYSAQLMLQNMPAAIIKRHFGVDAVWPELSKKELFDMVSITIRSGSTSRPNKMRERDQWIQLLPIIQQTLEKVMMSQAQGQSQVVEPLINLLDETLQRFDEKLDSKTLLGIADEDGEGLQQPQLPEPPPVDENELFAQQVQRQQSALQLQKQQLELEKMRQELIQPPEMPEPEESEDDSQVMSAIAQMSQMIIGVMQAWKEEAAIRDQQLQAIQQQMALLSQPRESAPMTLNVQVDAAKGEVRKQMIVQRDEFGNIIGAQVAETEV